MIDLNVAFYGQYASFRIEMCAIYGALDIENIYELISAPTCFEQNEKESPVVRADPTTQSGQQHPFGKQPCNAYSSKSRAGCRGRGAVEQVPRPFSSSWVERAVRAGWENQLSFLFGRLHTVTGGAHYGRGRSKPAAG